jgi:hypothetical protein
MIILWNMLLFLADNLANNVVLGLEMTKPLVQCGQLEAH